MIEAVGLRKRYGTAEAVKDVSFTAGDGRVFGLLGPNGAGKTTVLKILAGYHFPTAGTALVDGVSVQDDPVGAKERIGYLPENAPVYGDLTVDEYLAFVAEARLIPKKDRRERVERVLEDCSLREVRYRRIDALSKGFRQRVGLAQAIVHDPPVLILDEPTTGLDPNQVLEVRDLVRRLAATKTVVLSTHILGEVEALCSEVLFLNDGRIVAQGSPEEIAAEIKGGASWDVVLKCPDAALLAEKLKGLTGLASATDAERVSSDAFAVRVAFAAGEGTDAGGERIFDWAVASGLKILALSRHRASLEDLFVELTRESDPR